MKNKLYFILGTIALIMAASETKAQNCDLYMPLVAGTVYEYQMYDSGDKASGSVSQKVNSATASADGYNVANITSISYDKKGKEESTANVNIKCNGTTLLFDLQSLISAESKKQWEGMDVKAEGVYMEYPQTLTEGMSLTDGTMTITVYDKGALFATMKITYYNRKVGGKESVTTPTGTYTATKITSDVKMENIVMNMSIPFNTKTAEYYAPEVGMVRNEAYSKNGKMLSYQLLNKITK